MPCTAPPPIRIPDDVYDQDLAIAVQNFQREHRLNVDGIAGLQTQVVLDTALAEPGSPLLMQARTAQLGPPCHSFSMR